MKIREGFVSNSSSSSFLILGKDVNIKDVDVNVIKDKRIYAVSDNTWNEGTDIFKIKSAEELAFLKAYDSNYNFGEYNFSFIDVCDIGVDEMEGEVDVSNFPKTGKIKYYNMERDHNSSDSLSDLQKRYDKEGEITKQMQKYLRAKKIKKIENDS